MRMNARCGHTVVAYIELSPNSMATNRWPKTKKCVHCYDVRRAAMKVIQPLPILFIVKTAQMQFRLIEAYLIMDQSIKSILYIKWKMQSVTETGMCGNLRDGKYHVSDAKRCEPQSLTMRCDK